LYLSNIRRQNLKIIIIGSGVVGAGIARELARYDCDITVLERGNDVSVGTSKANSGIVHAGHDAHTGSVKARYNVAGNAMFDALSLELDFPFRRNGSLVLCFEEVGLPKLEQLRAQGIANGVTDLEILSAEQVLALEPHVNKDVKGALYAKTGGIVSPYEMNIAYAENAAVNGAHFEFGCEVVDVKKNADTFTVTCKNGKNFTADVVINCAGVYADIINNMVCKRQLNIIARKGDYCLLDKQMGYLCDRTLFQLPTAMGKGTLVTPTTHGNILLGPTAVDKTDKDDVDTESEQLSSLFTKAQLTMPELNRRNIITQFSGLRAHLDSDDFVVGESDVKGFYNCAGIESPGLTSAPAIAVDVAKMVADKYNLPQNPNFVAKRKGIPSFAHLSNSERQKLVDANPAYGRIVCRCEMVTEGEIVDSIRRPLGAKDLDGVKRRTRSGMGRCQMGFCTPRVMEILARELGADMADVTKAGAGSNVVVGRTK
jgi:glycerol-3-phosphate dehydrogenase